MDIEGIECRTAMIISKELCNYNAYRTNNIYCMVHACMHAWHFYH